MNMRFIARSDPIVIVSLLVPVFGLMSAIALFLPRPQDTSQPQWRLAKDAAPGGLMAQVIQDNIQPGTTLDAGQMKVWKVQQPSQDVPLYLIDSRVANAAEQPQGNPLCGAQGCLFLAYIPAEKGHYQRVLNLYLNPHLPPKVTLLQPEAATLTVGLPCLVVKQLEHHKIRILHFCFNGSSYEIIDDQILPQVYE
jgi:hypothetical protein